ncbi:MAG: FkbM family methyltransferase [Ignavibacteriae bacterium]|nr:FkbM family methyltransferase [Ignavibacteriota bacterium]
MSRSGLTCPNSRIIAFEPDPEIFLTLKKNIESSGFENINLVNKAVWDKKTKIKFAAEGSAGGHILTSNECKGRLIEIETVRLLDLIDKQIDFLKIDIEGAETDLMIDLKDRLLNVDSIFIEYHSAFNEQQNLGEILNILKTNGFNYYIETGKPKSLMPFVKRETIGIGRYNNLLNIFGYRV